MRWGVGGVGKSEGRGEVGGRLYDGLRVVVEVVWLRVCVLGGGGRGRGGGGFGGGGGDLRVGGSWWPTVRWFSGCGGGVGAGWMRGG